jgi:BirA family biotin operon repressor/biotin-[acetyl-CoA-carboxylase] ligase
VRRFAQVDSTNRYLIDEARTGAPEGLVAVADFQRAGRGRLGRRWQAPAGSNLLVSVLLRPALEPRALHLCTVAAALATIGACTRVARLDVRIKWPNDLLVGERKLAGILAETVPSDGGAAPVGGGATGAHGGAAPADAVSAVTHRAVIVGVGVNVRWPPDGGTEGMAGSEEADVVRSATSIWRETGVAVEPASLLEAVLTELEPRVADLSTPEGRRRLTKDYRPRCVTLGQPVRVATAQGDIEGTAVDVTVDGHLVVRTDTGFRTVVAGDVVHVRSAH